MPKDDLSKVLKRLDSIDNRINRLESKFSRLGTSASEEVEEVVETPVEKIQEEPQPSKLEEAITKPEITFKGIEKSIGIKWFAGAGIVSLVFAAAFLIIYLIQNNLISPEAQILVGILIGFIVLFAGKTLQDRAHLFLGRSLIGGGFAILYFTIYAAHMLYQLIPVEVNLILLTLIIISAIVISLKYNSKTIAGGAFFLGYITPLITGTVSWFALPYAAALLIGTAYILTKRGWNFLAVGSSLLTYLVLIFWLVDPLSKELPQYSIILLIFLYVLFAITGVMSFGLEKARKGSILTILFVLISPFLFHIFSHLLLKEYFPSLIDLFPLMVVASFLLFAYVARRIGNNYLSYLLSAIGLSYLVMVLASFLGQAHIGMTNIVWLMVAQGFLLLLLSIKFRNTKLWAFSSLLYGLTFLHVLLISSWLLKSFDIYNFLESTRFLAFIAPIVLLYLSYLAVEKKGNLLPLDKKWADVAKNTYTIAATIMLTLLILLDFGQMWSSIFLIAEILFLLFLSFRFRSLTFFSLATIAGFLTFLKIGVWDALTLAALDLSNLIGSERVIAMALAIIAFYAIYIWLENKKGLFDKYAEVLNWIQNLFAVAATALTTSLITLEILSTDWLQNVQQTGISVVWVVQALIMLFLGFVFRIRLFRVMGVLLFLLSIIKVFLIDLSGLDVLYRIISFFVLGLILIAAAFLYSRFEKIV